MDSAQQIIAEVGPTAATLAAVLHKNSIQRFDDRAKSSKSISSRKPWPNPIARVTVRPVVGVHAVHKAAGRGPDSRNFAG